MDLAHVASDLPGRLRVKIPARKGNREFFEDLTSSLAKEVGVQRVESNPLTASVLVIHGSTSIRILERVESSGIFKVGKEVSKETGRTALAGRIVQSFKSFDTGVKKFTSGELDIPSVAFLLLAGLALFQIVSGNFMAPAWYTLAWYALNIFLKGLPGSTVEPA